MDDWIKETAATFKRLDGAANCAGVAGGNGDTTVQTQASLPYSLFNLQHLVALRDPGEKKAKFI